jgi:hypothetical protein
MDPGDELASVAHGPAESEPGEAAEDVEDIVGVGAASQDHGAAKEQGADARGGGGHQPEPAGAESCGPLTLWGYTTPVYSALIVLRINSLW